MPEKWNIFERCIFQICLTKAVVQSCFEMFCVHSSNFLEHGYIIQHPCSIFNDFLDPPLSGENSPMRNASVIMAVGQQANMSGGQ